MSTVSHHANAGFFLRLRHLLLMFGLVLCILILPASAILLPEATNEDVQDKGGTTIDYSNADQGYIMVKHKSNKNLKLRVSLKKALYTYNLRNDDEFEVFPLQAGDGKYKVEVFEQVSGTKYTKASSMKVSVKLADENLPFLYPSQYIWYTADSAAVAKGAELCAGATTDKEKVEAVYDFILQNFVYDYVRAMRVQQDKGYLPDVDSILEEKKGICFDLSAIMATMLRSQDVPVQMVIGFADTTYHAWNSVFVDGVWYQYDLTADIAGMRVRKYTTERIY